MKLLNTLAIAAVALALAGPALAEGHKGMKGDHFKRMDTNADGVVTKAEFQAKGDKMFAKMDGNGDGKVTKEESDAAREKWKAEHKAAKEGVNK